MGEYVCVCMMHICHGIITDPNPILIPMPTLVPGSAMDLGLELCGLPCNMTLRQQLRSGR